MVHVLHGSTLKHIRGLPAEEIRKGFYVLSCTFENSMHASYDEDRDLQFKECCATRVHPTVRVMHK